MRTLKPGRRGFTLIEVLVGFGLLSLLVLALGSITDFMGQNERAARSSLDYSALASRFQNVVLSDEFCTSALVRGGQTMNTAGPQNVSLYRPDGTVEFTAGTQYGQLTLTSITLDTLDTASRPTTAGGVWPSVLTFTIQRPDTSIPYVLTLMLNVSTSAGSTTIAKCNRIKFSDKNYAVPIVGTPDCPTTAVVNGCKASGTRNILTIANDGVTVQCTPDWTDCCDHATSYPVLALGSDPRMSATANVPQVVTCMPYKCNTSAGFDTYVKGVCCSNGFTVSGNPSVSAGDPTLDAQACP